MARMLETALIRLAPSRLILLSLDPDHANHQVIAYVDWVPKRLPIKFPRPVESTDQHKSDVKWIDRQKDGEELVCSFFRRFSFLTTFVLMSREGCVCVCVYTGKGGKALWSF